MWPCLARCLAPAQQQSVPDEEDDSPADIDMVLAPSGAGAAAQDTFVTKHALLGTIERDEVAVLKASWIISLQARGGRLAERDRLPRAAFWTAGELRKLTEKLDDDFGPLFVAYSCKRLAAGAHPDPAGFQLKVLAEALRKYLSTDVRRASSPLTQALRQRQLLHGSIVPDCAVFISWASLRTAPPLSNDEARGLDALSLWFGHERVVCWMQPDVPAGFNGTAYESGWNAYEAAVSHLLKWQPHSRLDLSAARFQADLPAFHPHLTYSAVRDDQRGRPSSYLIDDPAHVVEMLCCVPRELPQLPADQASALLKLDFSSPEPFAQSAPGPPSARALDPNEKELMWLPGEEPAEISGAADEDAAGAASVEILASPSARAAKVAAAAYDRFFDKAAATTRRFKCVSVPWAGKRDAKQVAATLARFTALTALDLSDTRFGAEGCLEIVEALRGVIDADAMTSILWADGRIADCYEQLDAKNGWMELRGAYEKLGVVKLVEAIAPMGHLTQLDLGGNWIELAEAQRLLDVLRGKPLVHLGLRQTILGHYGGGSLADFMRATPTLRTVDIRGAKLDDTARSHVEDVVRASGDLIRVLM